MSLYMNQADSGPTTCGPSSLAKRIEAALVDDPRTADFPISVTVTAGEVTLEGSVPTREARQAAEAVVQDVRGVALVVNELIVKSGSGSTRSPQNAVLS